MIGCFIVDVWWMGRWLGVGSCSLGGLGGMVLRGFLVLECDVSLGGGLMNLRGWLGLEVEVILRGIGVDDFCVIILYFEVWFVFRE